MEVGKQWGAEKEIKEGTRRKRQKRSKERKRTLFEIVDKQKWVFETADKQKSV